MNCAMNCAMKCHRSFVIFRASLRSMPTLETIEEETYDSGIEPIGEPPEIYFNKDCNHWQEADWGQWTDIEYDYILVN